MTTIPRLDWDDTTLLLVGETRSLGSRFHQRARQLRDPKGDSPDTEAISTLVGTPDPTR